MLNIYISCSNQNTFFFVSSELGSYKKSVKSRRYPEGCISEHYITQESTTYCNLYMGVAERRDERIDTNVSQYGISVVSELVRPDQCISRARLTEQDILEAHWRVLLECNEMRHYLGEHEKLYMQENQDFDEKSRRMNFYPYFLNWVCEIFFL